VTENTIADKLATKPNTKVSLSDAVHLELGGLIPGVFRVGQLPDGDEMNASSAAPNKRLERTGGEAVCHYAGIGGRRTLNRRSLGPKRHGFTLRKERQVLIR
jgi:hypothetical protein